MLYHFKSPHAKSNRCYVQHLPNTLPCHQPNHFENNFKQNVAYKIR